MREINLIVIHCSATREDRCFTEYDLEECHRRRGFDGAGYHFYIRKNGKIVTTRPVERIGAHAKGFIFLVLILPSCYLVYKSTI
ncbi:N-acetylmuramoyl-L-alanine amidase [Bacteroides fragilis]|uniref:N-acetylmuramoyl-L-alanine amidase n=1 Tax=Bacteroides fragilis TaxID=817 RepID=A0A5M5P6M1_BACFG|nr:N-acetylmuramoyl-L-alanine amidase [Bacteroides fragilis]KAA4707325.1 N-acetylmuramoyl-L-alanine amidase [Bacteroides fragilis]KAA4717063.1 N-acetylmuramoyl-L-alanine amidase [Bacteroides fragilis]KAA4722399.1 N-acetylmuramoyl-L-alanine amidase [Bacteroides fragilis]KAA4731030.1 N-acetylmuramoyl-L-alanine amidase [Bacteroides fragilis]